MRGISKAAVAAVGSMLLLTACGSDPGTTEAGSGGNASEEPVIVWINPLSGTTAAFGEASRGGVQLALKDINESGGIDGADLQVVFEDNEHDPQTSITAYQRTIGQDPVAIMTAGTSVVLALAPLAEKDGVMVANIGGQSPVLISPELQQVYNFIPTSAAEASRLATRLAEDEGITNVGVLAVDND